MKSISRLIVLACAGLLFSAGAAAADKVLADRHADRGVKCDACHKAMPPKSPDNPTCFACHGSWEKLAKRTDKKDINPHDTHVESPACTECHSGHKRPKLLCDQCHEFRDIKVP